MLSLSLPQIADLQLDEARVSSSARAALTIHGGHERSLRETVIAILAGHGLGEHESPGRPHSRSCVVMCGSSRATTAGRDCRGITSSSLIGGIRWRRSRMPRCSSPWSSHSREHR